MDFKTLANKRIAGVPVLYLAGAFVVILAVVAWRMKSTETDEVTGDESTTTENVPESDADGDAGNYAGLASNGTVTVVQQPTVTEAEVAEPTNLEWERKAIALIMADKKVTATLAQSAVNKYLDGADLTYDESLLIDYAVGKLGTPPVRVSIGGVGAKPAAVTAPAQKQFTVLPGTHTVKNANDNTYREIARLYYGRESMDEINKLASENSNLGSAQVTLSAGTKVRVPKWYAPEYYTANASTRTAYAIAKKNGITATNVIYLNPTKVFPVGVGTKVRVK